MSRRVVVVGGGLAGIAAALEAADGGAEVVLVERRRHLGGLTWSFRRRGLWLDNGQHVFMRCCTAYLGLLDRIGASDQVVLQDRLDVPVLAPGGRRASIRRTGLPAPLHLAGSLARYRHLPLVDRMRLARPVLALRGLDLADPTLDAVTFGAWLAGHRQRPGAVERLWDLITLPTLNVPAAEASLAMAAKVFRTGLLDRADGADIGWSAVPLRQLHGANAEAALAGAGVEVLLGEVVDAVTARAGEAPTVQVSGRSLAADAVVVATPHQVAATLVPAGVLGDVGHLGASPIVNVHLVFDRTVTDLPMVAAVGSPVQFVFDRTRSAGLDRGQYLAVSLSGADAYVGRRPEELVRGFAEALADLFPAAGRARLVDGAVSREHAATFRARPGTAALRPPATTSLPGLFLAGAWCATGWPATMEGAVRSGVDAARQALGAGGSTDRTDRTLQEAPA
ncbi:MAG TPA: hydroxysqualene dehydroxylase HpnE [Acidimicrobiales bacterium]|nr:hydroxysqualene dehydroxylase HpnE [Acidimicrobiales bacterium]